MAKFVVTYVGEYDLDEWGNVVPVRQVFDTYEEAVEVARSWERETHCIATVDFTSRD